MNKLYIILLLIGLASCQNNKKLVKANDDAAFIDMSLFNSRIKIDSTLFNQNKNLQLFYKNFDNQTVWQSEDYRNTVIDELGNANNEGLLPADYNYPILKKYNDDYSDLSKALKVTFDLLLTENFQTYLSHISKGKLNPNKLYTDWDLKEKEVDVIGLSIACFEKDDFKNIINNCKPKHPMYENLKRAMALLSKYPEDNPVLFDEKIGKIVPGKSSKYVVNLKKRLMYWGDMKKSDTLTNVFGNETKEALKKFQKRHGLSPDGVAGKSTLEALNYTRNQRIEQIVANMERWRWYANDFGTNYIVSNIPDYKLAAIKDGDTMQSQRIVVGKDSRPTPILESKISNINLNPNWTVPPTILKEDIYPDAIKDKRTFQKKGLTIYDYKKRVVSPWDWKIEDAGKYSYVQKPSRNNSLGLMKINFPNKHSVYMHDTNHRDLFSRTNRSMSSGCVRLEKPLIMAAYLLNDEENWPEQKIRDTTDITYYRKIIREKEKKLNEKNDKLMAKNPLLVIPRKKLADPELETIVIKITEDIFIHQLYWTAWEQNGTLQFREDIYCLDQDLYSKLRYNL